MYLDKPLRDHNLLQAIARTNRPLPSMKKRTGVVVDYFGVFTNLEKALNFDESVREESLIDWDALRAAVPAEVAQCLEPFDGIAIADTRECLLGALRRLRAPETAKGFDQLPAFPPAFRGLLQPCGPSSATGATPSWRASGSRSRRVRTIRSFAPGITRDNSGIRGMPTLASGLRISSQLGPVETIPQTHRGPHGLSMTRSVKRAIVGMSGDPSNIRLMFVYRRARRVRWRLPPPPPSPAGARTPGSRRAHRRFLVVCGALSAVAGEATEKRGTTEARWQPVCRRSSREPGVVVRGGRSRDTRPRKADGGSDLRPAGAGASVRSRGSFGFCRRRRPVRTTPHPVSGPRNQSSESPSSASGWRLRGWRRAACRRG